MVGTGPPAGLPGGSGSDINLNTYGYWNEPSMGPNVDVTKKTANKRNSVLDFTNRHGRLARYRFQIGDRWLTYPAGAGSSDLAVHIKTTRAKFGSDDDINQGSSNLSTKSTLPSAKKEIEAAGLSFSSFDFFTTEAHLQAPGTAVQPTAQGSETSATWTGKAIAFDSAVNSLLVRGQEIGGDATVTVNFGATATVDVSLRNLKGARFVEDSLDRASPYPSQTWTGLTLNNGGFSSTTGSREIQGTFRNQGSTTGTNANTVGGIFDVYGTMKGGFVATYDD